MPESAPGVRRPRAAKWVLADLEAWERCVALVEARPALNATQVAAELGIGVAKVRRVWKQGVPEEQRPPVERHRRRIIDEASAASGLVDTREGIKRAIHRSPASKQTKADIQAKADRALVAAADKVIASLDEGTAALREAHFKIHADAAKALTEEAALVNNSRRTSMAMLSKLVTVVRASDPMIATLAARLATESADMSIPQALSYMSKLVSIGKDITALGEASINLRRRIVGEAEQTIRVVREDQPVDDMTAEDALKELEEVQTLLAQAEQHSRLRLAGSQAPIIDADVA